MIHFHTLTAILLIITGQNNVRSFTPSLYSIPQQSAHGNIKNGRRNCQRQTCLEPPFLRLDGNTKRKHSARFSSPSDDEYSSSGFNMSKPTFDILSLRSIRADALIQYSSLNQSEPLRINLYALLSLTLLSLPSLSEAVFGEEMTSVSAIASALSGVVSAGLFLRECSRRTTQLTRMERELDAEFLKVGIYNRFGSAQKTTLKSIRGKKRVLAIMGDADALKQVLIPLRVLRRRLDQANTIVVPVPLDSSKKADWGLGVDGTWLADATFTDEWVNYFRSLVEEDANTEKGGAVWFGLNYRGRSFTSGKGEDFPRPLQLMGTFLTPAVLLDETDESEETVVRGEEESRSSVLMAQSRFYGALTSGDLDAMNGIINDKVSPQVTEVLEKGGRVDEWKSCLADGARPEGMLTSGSDALILSPTEAYTTVIEFPSSNFATSNSQTLLAVQKWTRPDSDSEWKLALHETIPWSADSKAGGVLRCDCRGCVALTRTEKRTFGGLIG